MAESDLGGRSKRWPFHSAHFWCGLLAGVGVGVGIANGQKPPLGGERWFRHVRPSQEDALASLCPGIGLMFSEVAS